MEIKGSNSNISSLKPLQTDSSNTALKKGQILNGVVSNITKTGVVIDIISPKFDIRLQATQNYNFQIGQKLLLQVTTLSAPITIDVLQNQKTELPIMNTVLNSALRQILPKNLSFNQLLANLHYLSNPNPKLNSIYPQEILDLSRAVFQQLVSLKDISSSLGLKTALQNSGIFLEQQIFETHLNSKNISSNNVRISLLRLSEALKIRLLDTSLELNPSSLINKKLSNQNQFESYKNNNPYSKNQHNQVTKHYPNLNEQKKLNSNLTNITNPKAALTELLTNIDNSLAKLQFNQLQHFMSDDQLKTIWFFDLPIRHEDGTDVLHFRFTKQDKSKNNSNNDEFSITLTFNLEQLGNLNIHLLLKDQRIKTTIWAKKYDTYILFKQYLSELHHKLEQSGLKISSIHINNSTIPELQNTTINNILDEKV